MLALIAFTTFVFDYGVFYVSRRQAQTAADAGALAGAISLTYDSTDTSATGPATLAAVAVAQSNPVWAAAPIVDPAQGDVFIRSGVGVCPPPNSDGTCITVDAYRSTERNNPLPMFFGSLVGLTQQNVRATATAQVMIADATDCLKPWAVVDKWTEKQDPGGWTVTSTFDKYDKKGDLDPSVVPPDVYTPPTTTDYGSGFHPFEDPEYKVYSTDYGLQLNLKVGDKTDFDFATGWFSALALFDSKGGSDYAANIKGCVGVTYKIGDEIPVNTEPGEKVGPTNHAVETDTDSLVNQDKDAYWDESLNGGHGGVAGSKFGSSPRIVAIPLVNPDIMAEVQKGGRTTVPLANIAGFFVEGYDNSTKSVVGRLMTMPGLKATGAAPVGGSSAFLHTVVLVR